MIDKIQKDTNYFDTFGLSRIMIDKIQIDTNYFYTFGLSLIIIDKIQIDTNYFDTFGLSLIMIDKIQIIYSNITVDGARVVSLPRRLSSLQDMEGNRVFSLCIYCSVLWTMFVPFVLTIVVSVLLRFTTFDYPFKLVLFDM